MATTIFTDAHKGATGDYTTDGGAVYVAITVESKAVTFIREDARGTLSTPVTVTAFGTGCKSAVVMQEDATNRAALRIVAVVADGTTKRARSTDGGRTWALIN